MRAEGKKKSERKRKWKKIHNYKYISHLMLNAIVINRENDK